MKRHRLQLVIVGGGPAGLSLALHLAHRGHTGGVLLLERARYPRDKICAGMVAERAHRMLARIGVVVCVPEAPIHELSLGLDGGTVRVREARLGGVVRRAELDHALAREVRRRGIELREGARVTALERSSHGVVIRLEGGEALEARAVVGADGVGSVVRRALGLEHGKRLARAIEVLTPPVVGDPPPDAIHFDFGDRALRGYVWDFPSPGGLVCRGVYCTDRAEARTLRRRLEAHLQRKGLALAALEPRQAAQRWFEPAAPISAHRALLIGEAAGIDVVTGEGIPQAIAYGAEAARYLSERLPAGRLGFEDWLARVRRSPFGRRMRVRHASSAVFFGPQRPEMERLIRTTPAALRLWARDFAGASLTPADLAAGLWQTAPQVLRRGRTLAAATRALLAALIVP